jgi:N-acyl-D-aspartate/D-glutamate deacylase
VKGLVVSPGFIDVHAQGQKPETYRYQARDGVTTALETEVGAWPVAAWYAAREGKSLINFGATAGLIPATIAVLGDSGTFVPRDVAIQRGTTDAERRQIRMHLEQGLSEGALGIGLGLEYLPKTTRLEIFELFELAAQHQLPCFVHMRHKGYFEPGVINALQEVLANSAASGAPLHIMHIPSTAQGTTPVALRMIEGARKRGVDVTTEAYPYTAGMTRLDSALFEAGWQERWSIGYKDLLWVATGERLNAESFARYRREGGFVIIHSMTPEVVRAAIIRPLVMIASDSLIENGKGHPRSTGTFARVLSRYVREQRALSLMEALRKMTYMPAQRAGLLTKGRIQVGADADLAVFDPERVIDKSTFENPAQSSEGIPHVLVAGVFVVRDGKIESRVLPGKGVRSVLYTSGKTK